MSKLCACLQSPIEPSLLTLNRQEDVPQRLRICDPKADDRPRTRKRHDRRTTAPHTLSFSLPFCGPRLVRRLFPISPFHPNDQTKWAPARPSRAHHMCGRGMKELCAAHGSRHVLTVFGSQRFPAGGEQITWLTLFSLKNSSGPPTISQDMLDQLQSSPEVSAHTLGNYHSPL